MAAGLFGALGYDMIRLAEPVWVPPSPMLLDLPDAVMTRPSVVAIFDSIGPGDHADHHPVRPGWPINAEDAYAAAARRSWRKVEADLARPPEPPVPALSARDGEPPTNPAWKCPSHAHP